MRNQINVTNFNVSSMAQNSNINFGPSLQNSHTANSKVFGANFSMGDYSPVNTCQNISVVDQSQDGQGQSEE